VYYKTFWQKFNLVTAVPRLLRVWTPMAYSNRKCWT